MPWDSYLDGRHVTWVYCSQGHMQMSHLAWVDWFRPVFITNPGSLNKTKSVFPSIAKIAWKWNDRSGFRGWVLLAFHFLCIFNTTWNWMRSTYLTSSVCIPILLRNPIREPANVRFEHSSFQLIWPTKLSCVKPNQILSCSGISNSTFRLWASKIMTQSWLSRGLSSMYVTNK